MKFRLTSIKRDNSKDINSVNRMLIELIENLEQVLGNIDGENVSAAYEEKMIKRPVGSVEFRYVHENNAGYGYGEWKLMEDTLSTQKGFLYVYMRIK